MNFLIGMLVGLAFGWATYNMLGRDPTLTRKTALLVAMFVATTVTQLQPVFDPNETGAALRLAGIVWAALAASCSVLTVGFVAGRISRE